MKKAKIWAQLVQNWGSNRPSKLLRKGKIYYISRGLFAVVFLAQLSSDFGYSGFLHHIRARFHWNMWCHQMSFEISFMDSVETLSFLFFCQPTGGMNLISNDIDGATCFNVTEPLRVKKQFQPNLNFLTYPTIAYWFSFVCKKYICC